MKASKIDITVAGRVVKQGLQLWHVDASYFKAWVHARIEWPADQPGAWILPTDVTDEYCRQVVAESQMPLPNGRRIWKRHAPNNHYLDVEALCAAGAHMLQIHRMQPAAAAPAQGSGAGRSVGRRILSKGIR